MSATDESNPQNQDQRRHQPTETELRTARAAQKLRENLMRRKQQARARRSGQADLTEGLPAARADESST
ncbi:hypothetical protein [Rhizobium straminoryzae]|uniref:Uncharacterized protein n=1 Tax=Rhizobium straminoryzae TaxID=1387186 RepID=A0A549TI87_9HYPH|nr:hypothetical protein [Rhizobium straminoryzae]TRL42964.1 hypothetical protein FNA46_00690 [Rhizobium straminoryzae]